MVFQVGGEVQEPFQIGGEVNEPFQQQPQQLDQQRISQLLDQLGGKLPGVDPIPVAGFPGPEEEQRRRAFKELIQRGLSREQIELSSKVQSVLGGTRIGRPVGGILGAIGTTAIAGRIIPGPFDDVGILAALLAAGGGGIAGVGGEAIQTGIEEKRLISKHEALHAFAIEAGAELGGRGIIRAAKFVAGPFIKKTVPEAAALIDDFAKVGGTFSPTELDRRFPLRIGEAFSRGGFGAKEIFQEFEERQGKAALAFADGIIDAVGEGVARQPIREIGEEFAKGITKPGGRVFNILDDLFEPLYKQLDDLVKESTTGFRQVKKAAKVIRRGGPVEQLIPEVPGIDKESRAILLRALRTGEIPDAFPSQKIMTDIITDLPGTTVLGPEETAKALRAHLAGKIPLADKTDIQGLYLKNVLLPKAKAAIAKPAKAVRGITGRFIPTKELQPLRTGAGVSTNSLKAFAKKIRDQNKRLVSIAKRTGRDLPLLSPAGKRVLNDIDNLPETLRHVDYRAFRTKTLKETRKLNRDADISESMIKRISDITRKEMLDPSTVSNTSIEARRLHANISNLYAATQKSLQEEFSERLAKRLVKNPSSILKEIIPENNPAGMEILRKSIVEPIQGIPSTEGKLLWNQIRQAWLADIVEQSTKEGVVNPKIYNNLLRKMGRPAFKEMFPEPAVRQSVDKIQDLFTIVGKTPPTGASLFSRGAQTLGVVKMWQGAKATDFVGILSGGFLSIGPLAFAKMATTPRGVKLLTAGLKIKPGASELGPLIIRMVRLLREIDRSENRQRQLGLRQLREQKRAAREPTLPQFRGFGGRGF